MDKHTSTTQLWSLGAVVAASVWVYFFPHIDLYASEVVEWVLTILQSMIVPNAFMSLLTAVLVLSSRQLKKLALCFIKSIVMLWGGVSVSLLLLWFVLSQGQVEQTVLPTFTADKIGLVISVPLIMCLAVVLGSIIGSSVRLKTWIPYIREYQHYVSYLFDYVRFLIPVLVFFVMVKFLAYANFDKTVFVIEYFSLALLFVLVMALAVLPLLYRSFLKVTYKEYCALVWPVVLTTFLAGDSIAAVPLLAKAADEHDDEERHVISRVITLVVICFPWVGELANLVFPVYTAVLEKYDLSSVLSMLSVGPFFMFTDPYISIPRLLEVYGFSEAYQVSYMTIALLTDHMFEVCESLAVLFVVMRLKATLSLHNAFESND